MTVFWSLAAGMMVLALLFTVPPLLRSQKRLEVSEDDLNTAVIKAQLAELDADLEAGKLDRAQYAAARKDLERELLYDLAGSDDTAASASPRSGRWAALVLLPAVPVCAVLLYQQLGSEQIIGLLQQTAASRPPAAQTQGQPHSIQEMVAQLAARLRDEPDNLQGWVLLARSYTSMGRHADAVEAYANIRRLGGDQPALLADYADTLVMANGGRFTDEAGALLEKALELDPENLKSLWLMGHWKYGQGAYAEALDYWQRAAAKLPPDGQDARVIAQQISQAQSQLGISSTPPLLSAQAAAQTAADATAGQSDTAGAAAITVQVSLDPAISDAAAPDDTLFIFARAAQGPRMPLAIVRKQVKDLPLTVTLDDSLAMSPAMTLSKFGEVTVGARVSKSGNAMPQSGDLQGTVSPVATQGAQPVQVNIDNKVP
jgi:cytochrome c-type biogenesis protein CcmH